MTRENKRVVMLEDLAGLWSVRPWLALAMAVIMLALLGFPVFGGAGFLAKWYLLQAALQSPVRQTSLAVILVLTTVVSAGYYLWVVMLMFMRPRPEGAPEPERSGGLTQMVLAITVVLLLIIGVAPDFVVRAARNGVPRMDVEASTTQLPPRSSLAPPDSARQVAERAGAANR
jgi:NADH-quinone oxidoreductase subunit N